MNINLPVGKYVVAVSGGVDSVVLLYLLHHQNSLSKEAPWKLVVAHFDHGIRTDSAEDRGLVESLARKYKLPFFYEEGKLGPNAGEALAREKRYEFLKKVKRDVSADAVITAHHQDDLLETAIINLLRGTKYKGLSSLRSTADIKRPLLGFTKKQISNYAKQNNLSWREDSTNSDEKYLRNYVRLQIMPKFDKGSKRRLLTFIESSRQTGDEINSLLNEILGIWPDRTQLDRQWFVNLPHAVAAEIMAAWLRQNAVEFDRKTIGRAVLGAKTLNPGKSVDLDKNVRLIVKSKALALAGIDR